MQDEEKKPTNNSSRRGMSRRKFLKGVGVGSSVLSSGLLGGPLLPEVEAQSPSAKSPPAKSPSARVFGPAAAPIELTVNGQRRSLRLEPRVTLLEALRDHLELTGAKRVCDRASCGACTAILNGVVVYSCSVLAIEAQGKSIQTVEGLARGSELHPVQSAFVEQDAQQCGFCTSGFVMAVKAFLDKHPNPTAEQMRLGLGGNLCRCGTYDGIKRAVLEAARKLPASRNRNGQGGRADA